MEDPFIEKDAFSLPDLIVAISIASRSPRPTREGQTPKRIPSMTSKQNLRTKYMVSSSSKARRPSPRSNSDKNDKTFAPVTNYTQLISFRERRRFDHCLLELLPRQPRPDIDMSVDVLVVPQAPLESHILGYGGRQPLLDVP